MENKLVLENLCSSVGQKYRTLKSIMLSALGDLLSPYSEAIAAIAGTVTCLQFLSGVFFLNDIRKKGSADAFPATPFLGGIVLTVLSLKYGALVNDNTMIKVNFIGFAINVVFMMIFYAYTSNPNRPTLWGKIIAASLFTTGCFTYATYEDAELIEFRFGMLITTILVMLVGSPFLELGEIMKTKSTQNLPFPIILAGTIVSACWMFYGISIKNTVLAYQNAFLVLLSSIQLSLFVIYPRTPTKSTKSKFSSTKQNAKSPLKRD